MDDAVATFVEAARAFRSVLATEQDGETEEFARRLRNALRSSSIGARTRSTCCARCITLLAAT